MCVSYVDGWMKEIDEVCTCVHAYQPINIFDHVCVLCRHTYA